VFFDLSSGCTAQGAAHLGMYVAIHMSEPGFPAAFLEGHSTRRPFTATGDVMNGKDGLVRIDDRKTGAYLILDMRNWDEPLRTEYEPVSPPPDLYRQYHQAPADVRVVYGPIRETQLRVEWTENGLQPDRYDVFRAMTREQCDAMLVMDPMASCSEIVASGHSPTTTSHLVTGLMTYMPYTFHVCSTSGGWVRCSQQVTGTPAPAPKPPRMCPSGYERCEDLTCAPRGRCPL
jgi:hypothetical protein